MNPKQKKIFDHFGEDCQVDKTFEELSELEEAIAEEDKEHITEEFADFLNCMDYIMHIYNITYQEVFEIKKQKQDRTLKRYNIA